MVLAPTKKDVKGDPYQGSTADPSGFPFEEETDQKWEKNDSGEDQVNDKDKVPGKSLLGERGEDHRSIRS